MLADFHKIGRNLLRKDPHFFRLLEDEVKECQEKSITNTSLISAYFHYFCEYKGLSPEEVRAIARRGGLELMTIRRLFIAVILKQYDQLYFEGIAGRMADKLRQSISDCLNCHEVWVSNVAPSVIHELRNLKGYVQEVQSIIDAIQPMVESGEVIPEYGNTRNFNNQLAFF